MKLIHDLTGFWVLALNVYWTQDAITPAK